MKLLIPDMWDKNEFPTPSFLVSMKRQKKPSKKVSIPWIGV
jgi:hypothetical protein